MSMGSRPFALPLSQSTKSVSACVTSKPRPLGASLVDSCATPFNAQSASSGDVTISNADFDNSSLKPAESTQSLRESEAPLSPKYLGATPPPLMIAMRSETADSCTLRSLQEGATMTRADVNCSATSTPSAERRTQGHVQPHFTLGDTNDSCGSLSSIADDSKPELDLIPVRSLTSLGNKNLSLGLDKEVAFTENSPNSSRSSSLCSTPIDDGTRQLPSRHEGSLDAMLPDLLPPQTQPNSVIADSNTDEYRRAGGLHKNPSTRSFQAYGFSSSSKPRSNSQINVNVAPRSLNSGGPGAGSAGSIGPLNGELAPSGLSETPEIKKYHKKFKDTINCASLWGVNLLIGTDNGLMLLDRSGAGKVYSLITKRKFTQMDVLEGQNILVTISGKYNKIRVYYLSFLKTKIFRNEEIEKKNGFINVGEMQNCVHFKIVKYERIRFLIVALQNSIEIYAWAPKPYHKFMEFKSFSALAEQPLLVDLTIEEGTRLKVLFGSAHGFHAIDLDTSQVFDLYFPSTLNQAEIIPHAIVILPQTNGLDLLLCFNNECVYVNTSGDLSNRPIVQWSETPSTVDCTSSMQLMGWGQRAIEIRAVATGHLEGVFMHRNSQKFKFLCERNDKVFFSSMKSTQNQIYFMSLQRSNMMNW